VDGHDEDDGEPQVEVEVVGADSLDDQAVVQHAQEERPDQRADDRSRAAPQERPADHGGRDRLEEDFVRAGGGRRGSVGTHSREDVPGVGTGAECEITSVSPSSVNSIPNVATNEEMPTTAMKNPLIAPISALPHRARITAGKSGRPALADSL